MTRGWIGALLAAATILTPIAASAQDRGGFGARQIRQAQREGRAADVQRAPRDVQRAPRGDNGAQRGPRPDGGNRGGGGVQRGPRPDGGNRPDGGVQRGDRGTGQWQGGRWRGDNRGAGNGTFDRNGDGRVDRRWDRNSNDRVDRQWDRNRDGQLDRRWDRNDNDRLDRRYDRNRDGRLDRRYDYDRDGRANRYDRYDNRNGRYNYNRWNRTWRDDRRYDWRGHRARYGSIYRWGPYYSPYRSWRYRPLSIGFTLQALFYSNRYWINDPWQYRLPNVYGPYRWVRYYNDALLVDVETGEVVDVINNFFW